MWGGLPPLSFLVVCFVWAGVVWAGLEGVSRTEAAAGWPCAVCVGLVGCGVVWCRKHACLWWAAAAVVVVVVCCGGDSRETAGVNSEEGGDDVKSSCPLCLGLHACYNGRYRGLRYREVERIP